MEKSCPGRVHWPRIKLLAIESTSAQNKEDCQEQTASLLNKEDKVLSLVVSFSIISLLCKGDCGLSYISSYSIVALLSLSLKDNL
jgi:hypothetical protein